MQVVLTLLAVTTTTAAERATTPPQLTEDGEHTDFGGPRTDDGGDCFYECITDFLYGFVPRALANVF
jgi:hypothetical protein